MEIDGIEKIIAGIAVLFIFAAGKLLLLLFNDRVAKSNLLFLMVVMIVIPGLGWAALLVMGLISLGPFEVKKKIAKTIDGMNPSDFARALDTQILNNAGDGNEGKWVADHWLNKTLDEKIAFLGTFVEAIKNAAKDQATITPIKGEVWCDWIQVMRTAHFAKSGIMA